MPTAVGRLRYGPQSHTIQRRSGWWLLLECDRDWYDHYAPLARRELPPQWVKAVDRTRTVDHGEPDSRLAVIRPWLCEPAWKPHISVCRREKPQRHADLWGLAIEIGDLQDEEVHLIESAAYLRDKAGRLAVEVAATDASKVKHIRRIEAEIHDCHRVAALRDAGLPTIRRNLRRAQRQWLQTAAQRGLSVDFEPGKPIEFEYNESPRTNGKHWWFDVRCERLLDLREAFGIQRRPRRDLHLTFAVHEGYENYR